MDMLDHKKNYCKMRFTCKCEEKEDGCSEKECSRVKELPSSQSPGYKNLIKMHVLMNLHISECDMTISKGKRVRLRCCQCKETFTGAWDLMFHVQNAHGINIYNLDEKEQVVHQDNTFALKWVQQR